VSPHSGQVEHDVAMEIPDLPTMPWEQEDAGDYGNRGMGGGSSSR